MKTRDICTLVMLFIFIAVLPSYAKPKAEEYLNKDYSYNSIKTVLIMPVMYETAIPQSEAFFDETIQQKWREVTSQEKSGFCFLVKTPKQLIERNDFVKGIETDGTISENKIAEKALSLSPEYADAIMTATVTKCEYGNIHHPTEIIWETRYEDRPVWVNGKWEKHSVPIRYQNIKPEWDEPYTLGAVKLELRNSKDNTLIYGVSVSANTTADLFTPPPSLTKHISNIIENAAKRVPRK